MGTKRGTDHQLSDWGAMNHGVGLVADTTEPFLLSLNSARSCFKCKNSATEPAACAVFNRFPHHVYVKKEPKRILDFDKFKRVLQTPHLWVIHFHYAPTPDCKNTGFRRAFLLKCPSRRANPSLDGRLGNTAEGPADAR